MHFTDKPDPSSVAPDLGLPSRPWWREMTRYHWFVFVVASLAWVLDCMDQQLFNLVRKSAVAELLPLPAADAPRLAGLAAQKGLPLTDREDAGIQEIVRGLHNDDV